MIVFTLQGWCFLEPAHSSIATLNQKNYKILRYSKGFEMKSFFLSSRPALIVVGNLLKFDKYNYYFRRKWTYIQSDTVKRRAAV